MDASIAPCYGGRRVKNGNSQPTHASERSGWGWVRTPVQAPDGGIDSFGRGLICRLNTPPRTKRSSTRSDIFLIINAGKGVVEQTLSTLGHCASLMSDDCSSPLLTVKLACVRSRHATPSIRRSAHQTCTSKRGVNPIIIWN